MDNISKEQLERAAKNVAPAFFNDPMSVHLMPDDSKRAKQLEWFFRLTYSYCHRWGKVISEPGLMSLGGLRPPNEHVMTSWRLLKVGFWKAPFVLEMRNFARLGSFSDEVEKIHKKLMPDPHWYLLALGTAPEAQGTGLGSTTLNRITEIAESSSMPLYLETMTEENVAFYERRGFNILKQFTVDSTVRTWAMSSD